MKQKYHLISSVISMTITSVLLIVVCLAWYVTNKEAYVTGVTGSTAVLEQETEDLVVSVEYYEIESINGNTYTIGNAITGLSNFELKPYNALSEEPHQILLKVNLNQNNLSINASITDSMVDINLKETTSEGVTKYIFMGATGSNNKPIKEIAKYNNQLSSIISFYYITDVENNQFTISDNQEECSFVKEEGKSYNKYLNDNITISENTGEYHSIYIMFDYVEGAIEDIYSVNLGSEALNPSEDQSDKHWMDIEYICDFKISIAKASGGVE